MRKESYPTEYDLKYREDEFPTDYGLRRPSDKTLFLGKPKIENVFEDEWLKAPQSTIAKKVLLWNLKNHAGGFLGDEDLTNEIYDGKRYDYYSNTQDLIYDLRYQSGRYWYPPGSIPTKKILTIAIILIIIAIILLIIAFILIFAVSSIWPFLIFLFLGIIFLILGILAFCYPGIKKKQHIKFLKEREKIFSRICEDYNQSSRFKFCNMTAKPGKFGTYLSVLQNSHIRSGVKDVSSLYKSKPVYIDQRSVSPSNKNSYVSYNRSTPKKEVRRIDSNKSYLSPSPPVKDVRRVSDSKIYLSPSPPLQKSIQRVSNNKSYLSPSPPPKNVRRISNGQNYINPSPPPQKIRRISNGQNYINPSPSPQNNIQRINRDKKYISPTSYTNNNGNY